MHPDDAPASMTGIIPKSKCTYVYVSICRLDPQASLLCLWCYVPFTYWNAENTSIAGNKKHWMEIFAVTPWWPKSHPILGAHTRKVVWLRIKSMSRGGRAMCRGCSLLQTDQRISIVFRAHAWIYKHVLLCEAVHTVRAYWQIPGTSRQVPRLSGNFLRVGCSSVLHIWITCSRERIGILSTPPLNTSCHWWLLMCSPLFLNACSLIML